MAGQQKAIFLRFNMEDEADSSLYMKLTEAAGSVSLTSYVKRALETEEQRKRHTVRQGLTGLAQVSGRNNISWEKNLSMI